MKKESIITLSKAASGQQVKLISIDAGRGLTHRLAELGLTPGVELSVVQADRSGPVLVSVRGSRIALGRGMAHKLKIEPIG
ncbi:MAG: ferrous iron transport protein A [Anaerolineales bacterium]|nr:ferrous iron transport protein A [Anaerolineales bacterium]